MFVFKGFYKGFIRFYRVFYKGFIGVDSNVDCNDGLIMA